MAAWGTLDILLLLFGVSYLFNIPLLSSHINIYQHYLVRALFHTWEIHFLTSFT